MRRRGFSFFPPFLLAVLGLLIGIDTLPVPAAEVINVGYTGPLSGGAAKYGQNNLDGLKMAVD